RSSRRPRRRESEEQRDARRPDQRLRENPCPPRPPTHVSTTVEPLRTISPEEELHWLALRLVSGLGMRKSVRIIERLRTPMAVFRASRSELEAQGLSGAVAQSIASGCTFEDAVLQQEHMAANDTVLVPFNSPMYPARLREIYDPPLVLFARGRVELMDSLTLAVVGTRRPTTYGK